MNLPQIFGRSSKPATDSTLPPLGGSIGTAHDPHSVSPELTEGRVYRSIAFDMETFDAFKAWGRALSAARGERIGNAGVLRMLVLAHAAPPAHPRTD